MSNDMREDHRRFRRVAGRYVKGVLRDFPDAAESDWIVRCWQSFDAFVGKFRDSADRDKAINDFERQDEIASKVAGDCCRVLLSPPINNSSSSRTDASCSWTTHFMN